MKQYITVIETKTKKLKKFPLCNDLLVEMEKYTSTTRVSNNKWKNNKRAG